MHLAINSVPLNMFFLSFSSNNREPENLQHYVASVKDCYLYELPASPDLKG
jgi:hypothetical protein